MIRESEFEIVRLVNGTHSIRCAANGETFHPVVGPVAEAEALYLRQLHLVKRCTDSTEPFVIWDVGLGAAGNVLTALRALRDCPKPLKIISFDHTLEPLRFGLEQREQLGFFAGYEVPVAELLTNKSTSFLNGVQPVEWTVIEGDFPTFLNSSAARLLEKPHAIFYDAYSPATNPTMWTLPVFSALASLLDSSRSCALPTYSRSTLLRVTLLLAGFYVGVGEATGEKEETTIAANSPQLIAQLLDARWLKRVQVSKSAEPLHEPVYRQAFLSQASWERLLAHPQFAGAAIEAALPAVRR